jgi:PAS domain S-box-containing protein
MFVMFAHTVVAQRRVADSLMVVLKKHIQEDTTRVNIMNDIAYAVYSNNSAMTADYAQKSGRLSDRLGYKKGKAASLWLLGLSNLGHDKKKSLDYFQQALAISEKINDRQGMSNYLIALGNVLRDLGQSKRGDQCYNRALEIATAIGDKQIELKCLMNISRSLSSKGMYPQAIEGLEKAISLAIELGDKTLLSRCYNNIGSTYMMQSNHPVALDYFLKAMRVNEQMHDKSALLGNLLNIAGVKSEQKDYKGALENAKKAMAIAGEIRDTMLLSVCLTDIGNIYLKTGNNQALEYFQRALALLGDNNIIQSINILINIGTIHRKNGSYTLALNSYGEALKLSEKIGLKRGIAQVLCNMGKVYLLQKDYTKALDYNLKSSNLARELGNLELLKDIHHQLADIYAAKNDFKRALEHHRLFKSYNDSIFNASNVKKIADLESAYKYDKERQRFEEEKQKRDMAIKSQRTIILTLSVAFIFMLLLAITLFRLYRLKKRTNTVLLQQKAKIEELNEEYAAVNEELTASNEALVMAKQKAEESEEKLQRIIGNSNDIIVLVNEKKDVLFISNVATNITGFSIDEIKHSFIDFVHPDDKESMKLHWELILNSDTLIDSIQFRYKQKNDGYLWLEAVAQNFLKNPSIGAVLSNIRNIDVQKKAEAAFIEREALHKKLLQLEIDKINEELDTNQKAMTAAALKLVQNSERDAQSIKALEDIMAGSEPEAQHSIKSLIANYKLQVYNSNWDEFELLFQKVHHSFHNKLNEQFPELTPNERKLCIFLKMNMNSKQIAQITFQSEEALKKARLRLRKKLDIDRDTNLVSFIQGL